MGITERVGVRVRERRRELRLTMRQVAHAVGVSTAQVCRIERGQSGITLEMLDALADVLALQPSELVGPRDPLAGRLPELEGWGVAA